MSDSWPEYGLPPYSVIAALSTPSTTSISLPSEDEAQGPPLPATDRPYRTDLIPAYVFEDLDRIFQNSKLLEMVKWGEENENSPLNKFEHRNRDDEDMDLWDDDDDFLDDYEDDDDELLRSEHAGLPGAEVEESTTSNLVEIDVDTSASTFGSTTAPSLPTVIHHVPMEEGLEQYNQSTNVFFQTLAVACIVIESYLTAYHRLWPRTSYENMTTYPLPSLSTRGTLFDHIVGGSHFPINLIPLSDFQNIYGIRFPYASTPPPPMPESFTLTPLDWMAPLRPREHERHHTRGSRPVNEVLSEGPDWMRLFMMKLAVDEYLRRRNEASTNEDELQVPTAPISLDHLVGLRKADRIIKPLPKRKSHVVDEMQQQRSRGAVPFVGSALGAALWGIGGAVVNGVKRLRDEFEGGFCERRKRTRND